MATEEPFQFTAVLEESTNKLWGSHIGVPQWVAEALIPGSEDRRMVCTLNEKVEYQCALLPRGDGSFLVTVNKKNCTQLGLKHGAKVNVSLRKDTSTYGLPMPEELAEVLAQDEQANTLFHALSPGKIRTLLYVAGNVKNSESRIFRAIAIAEHLKANKGRIDYKILNGDLKNPVR
ncbi:MAG: DUF1905 domain-containing protein [Lewinellaceae bacterium]|nr:DUF1905 domain-containing protein [Lewinellaceae bacterium]